jgi:hypothetical protein
MLTRTQKTRGDAPKRKAMEPLLTESSILVRRTPTNAIYLSSTCGQSVEPIFQKLVNAATKRGRGLHVRDRCIVNNEEAFIEDLDTEFEEGTAKAVKRVDILRNRSNGETEFFGSITLVENGGTCTTLEVTPSDELSENSLAIIFGEAIDKKIRNITQIPEWSCKDIS